MPSTNYSLRKVDSFDYTPLMTKNDRHHRRSRSPSPAVHKTIKKTSITTPVTPPLDILKEKIITSKAVTPTLKTTSIKKNVKKKTLTEVNSPLIVVSNAESKTDSPVFVSMTTSNESYPTPDHGNGNFCNDDSFESPLCSTVSPISHDQRSQITPEPQPIHSLGRPRCSKSECREIDFYATSPGRGNCTSCRCRVSGWKENIYAYSCPLFCCDCAEQLKVCEICGTSSNFEESRGGNELLKELRQLTPEPHQLSENENNGNDMEQDEQEELNEQEKLEQHDEQKKLEQLEEIELEQQQKETEPEQRQELQQQQEFKLQQQKDLKLLQEEHLKLQQQEELKSQQQQELKQQQQQQLPQKQEHEDSQQYHHQQPQHQQLPQASAAASSTISSTTSSTATSTKASTREWLRYKQNIMRDTMERCDRHNCSIFEKYRLTETI
eukprot:Awhi_evm1s13284